MKNFYYWLTIVLIISVVLPNSSFAKDTREIKENMRYNSTSTILPVELTEIKTYTDNEIEVITVEWETTSELNNIGFEIERSTNLSEGFEKIGFVEGEGNPNEGVSYSFGDENAIPGIRYYYRLKQLDFDGKFEYSQIASDRISPIKKIDLLVFPNPVTTNLIVDFKEVQAGAEQFRIVNLEGKTLFLGIMDIYAGKAEVDVSDLPNGIYFIEIQQGDNAETVKFIIHK